MSSPSPHPASDPADLPALRLSALRAELDRVDDALLDALMRRAELVAQVGALRVKGPTPLRPGREAQIARRLLARRRPPLSAALLLQIWREIITGFTAQQQRMVIAVADPALLPMARGHFGALSELDITDGAAPAITRLQSGEAGAALLRWPGEWWRALLDERAAAVNVVARLPFWRGAALEGADAMVLTLAAPDPSGEDRTLVATAAGELIEMDGFIEPGDARLAAIPGARVIGAYAVPLGVMQ